MWYLFATAFDVRLEFLNLLFQSLFGVRLEFGEVGFEVGFLPLLFPFGVQGSVGGNRSALEIEIERIGSEVKGSEVLEKSK